MNNDCIFNSLLYSNINNISNTLLICKHINLISTQYFWKLLCERDYKLEYMDFIDKSYYDNYRLCTELTNMTEKYNKIQKNIRHFMEFISFYDSYQRK